MGILGLVACVVLATQAPFRLGLCAAEGTESEGERGFVQGARLALDIRNRRGGVFGHPLELVLLGGGGSTRAARGALAGADELGLSGVIAPWSGACSTLVRAACARRGLAVASPVVDVELEAEVLVTGLTGALRCTRIGLLSDGSAAAKSLARALERGLTPPAELVLETRLPARDLATRIAELRPDVLVLDATPEEAEAALAGVLATLQTPLVLTSRAVGTLAGIERELLFVHGLSPASAPPRGEFLAEYRARHGEPDCGAVEGFELVELFATAIERAGTGERAAVLAALATTRLEGPRGLLAPDAAGVLAARPALWRLTEVSRPHLPPALLAGETIPDGEGRVPDPRLGAPFGGLRTDGFRLERGTQAVRVHFGSGARRSIEADLAQLGLASGGSAPFVDHLVREELLARTLSIVSSKYLRAADGSSIPGTSLRVSFGAHLAAGESVRAWEAELAGADPRANGRAFPGEGRCQVFTTNWLVKEIAHALTPPIGAGDLGYLDGTYVYGSDYLKDRRSELIRALIQGYASSLGLTTAHEVGHLFGLEHDSGDPTSLMSVDEERGLAPEDARFSEAALARLRKSPGVAK